MISSNLQYRIELVIDVMGRIVVGQVGCSQTELRIALNITEWNLYFIVYNFT